MAVTWHITDDSTKHEFTWRQAEFAVTATEYDTGEWRIFYGTVEPVEVYQANIYSREEAVRVAKQCMYDVTNGVIGVESTDLA